MGYAQDGANDNERTAVLWRNGEIFSLQELLEAAGLNLEGGHLEEAFAISSNGLQVIGRLTLSGKDCAYKAILPSKYSQ